MEVTWGRTSLLSPPLNLDLPQWPKHLIRILEDGEQLKSIWVGGFIVAQRVKTLASIREDEDSIPGLTQWVKDLGCCELWHSLVAAALIRPLAWELSFICCRHGPKKEPKEKKKKASEE